jgi:RNA polymerase sigma-70 factor, ECF subfamily
MLRAAPTAAAEPPDLTDGDAALVTAARSGDRAALTGLYRRYAPMVHAVLLSRVPAAEADDLVQEVFLHAMDRLDSLREPAALGGWLAAIARNAGASFLRSRRVAGSGELVDTLPGMSEDGSAAAEAHEALAAIRSLPEAYRETLMMRLVEGMTGPQIAARMGMTHGSVRVNLHRGMAMLRGRLGESGSSGAGQQGSHP